MRVSLRRLRYIGRGLYWAARHCSFEHATWICEYEGLRW
jgi:hypothetical protein